jgi:hypothetical protein
VTADLVSLRAGPVAAAAFREGEVLDDSDPIVRIAALQGLTRLRDAVLDALAAALVATDRPVRSVAQQMVLNRGAGGHAVEPVTIRALDGDKTSLWFLLGAVITRRGPRRPEVSRRPSARRWIVARQRG